MMTYQISLTLHNIKQTKTLLKFTLFVEKYSQLKGKITIIVNAF